MENLAELFIALTLASGQWAAPIQQGSALDTTVSGTPRDGAMSSITPDGTPTIRSAIGDATEGRDSDLDGRQAPVPSSAEFIGLSPGDRVRFRTTGETRLSEGYVVTASPETLQLRLRSVDKPLLVSWSSLRRLDVHRGGHSLAGRGAMIGALSAGIPWVIYGGFSSWLFGQGWGNILVNPRLWAGAAVGAGAGALIGATIRTDRWDELDLPPIRVGVSPQRGGGLAVALSMRS